MRTAIVFLAVAIGVVSSGCSLCDTGYLCDYAGVGGKWQRTDPEYGRVGSIFSDPNSAVVGASGEMAEVVTEGEHMDAGDLPSTDNILEPIDAPEPAEEGVIILGDQM